MNKTLTKFLAGILSAVMLMSAIPVFALDDNEVAGSEVNIETDISDGNIVIVDDDNVLVEGVDYTLTYRDNVEVGTGTVIVTFIGNYAGTKEAQFAIKKKTASPSSGGGGSSKPSEKYNVTIEDENGDKINATKKESTDGITITLPSGKELADDSSYTITITDKNGKPAQTNVTIKDAKGNSASGTTDENGKVTLPETVATETPEPTEIPADEYEHRAYIQGYGNGIFIPDGCITRAETAKMLDSVMPTENNGIDVEFSDVKSDDWYFESVMNMSAAGYIKGYADGTFKPEQQITRAEFVAMLMRILGTETCEEAPFPDVEMWLWSADYIYSAAKAGYINGYEDGSFRPDGYITRAETVKIINLALDRTDLSAADNPFNDVASTHWAYEQIIEAAVDHIITE